MSPAATKEDKDLARLFDEIESAVAHSPNDYAKSRIARLQRIVDERSALEAPDASEAQSELAGRAVELMSANMQAPLTITQIATECGTSPTMLKQTFRTVMGMPVYQWYRHQRLTRACTLLAETDLSISQVAFGVGYANSSKFAKAFREEFGKSPSDWRKSK